jgi:NADH-quinone oxidoreductase subunit H
LQVIVARQADGEIFGWGGLGNPYFLTQFVGMIIFLVAAQAELTQTPFDMPVAESEIVAGYMTEYSGLRFLLFFIAEFASIGALAAIAATLFMGGWYIPGLDLDSDYMNILGPLILFVKILAIAGLIFFVRFTYPRFREDQLQRFAWTVLIPLALVNIILTMILKVAF